VIGIEFLPAELSWGVDAFSAVDGFDRHQGAQLRRDLDQETISQSVWLKRARSAVVVPFNSMPGLPRRPSSSIAHSGAQASAGGTISSTNAGGLARLFGTPGPGLRNRLGAIKTPSRAITSTLPIQIRPSHASSPKGHMKFRPISRNANRRPTNGTLSVA
jgi:hypothetical protein